MEERNNLDRRRDPRYPVKSGVIAVLHCDSGKVLGPVVDVSRSGICFSFIESERDFEARCGQVDVKNGTLDMKMIPCDVAWMGYAASPSPFNVVRMRKSGLRFKDLHPEMVALLDTFIEKNAVVGNA